MDKPSSIPPVGIDFGSENCVVIIRRGDSEKYEVVEDEQGEILIPSCVYLSETGFLVGTAAWHAMRPDPTNGVTGWKKYLGCTYDANLMKTAPFEIVPHPEKKSVPAVRFRQRGCEKFLQLEELTGLLFSHLKRVTEKRIGQAFSEVSISIPSYYSLAQIQALSIGVQIAGLKPHFVSEPTCAMLAYKSYYNKADDGIGLVFDFSKTNIFATAVRHTHSVSLPRQLGFEVLAAAGGASSAIVSGADFDERIALYLAEEFGRRYQREVERGSHEWRRILIEAERVKKALSIQYMATAFVDDLYPKMSISIQITRARFEFLCRDLFLKTLEPVKAVLRDQQLGASDISSVILVGGMSKIPRIRELLASFFNAPKILKAVNSELVVAVGAFQHAFDLKPHERHGSFIKPVLPLTIGYEDSLGTLRPLALRGTALPTIAALDNFDAKQIKIFEGEHLNAKCNIPILVLSLETLAPPVLLEFHIDEHFALSVKARSKETKQELSVSCNPATPDATAVKRMLQSAEQHREAELKALERSILVDEFESAVAKAGLTNDPKVEEGVQGLTSWFKAHQQVAPIDQIRAKIEEAKKLYLM